MPSSREHAFDALRAAMLLSLLVLHAGVSYMATPLGALWPFQDRSTSIAFDLLVAFLHTFRIPLLFFVAGYFAASLYSQRGPRGFALHRLKRIGVPLLVAWVVTAPLTLAAFWTAVSARGGAGQPMPPLSAGDIAGHLQWFHLWFMADLLIYYAAACALAPLARRLSPGIRQRGYRMLDAYFRSAWAPLVGAPLTALTLLPMASATIETPGTFARPPATLLANGVFVLAGWCLYLRREAVPGLPARAWSRVAWGIGLFFVYAWFLLRLHAGDARWHLAAIAALSACCWFFVFGLSGLFVRYFSVPSVLGRYLSDASYWCYLAHLPVVAWCSVGLSGFAWPSGVKYAVVLLVTTFVCLVTYEIGVRSTRVGAGLNGRRYPRGWLRAREVRQPAGTPDAEGSAVRNSERPFRLLLVLPGSQWRRNLKGRAGPTERIFDYSVLPCLYLAASVPPGVSVRIVNEDYEAIDFDGEVDLVGLSIMTMNAPRAYEIAARFREHGVPVIAGGFHATLHPQDVLEHVDAVCVGDGERVMPRIIDDLRAGRLGRRYEARLEDLGALPIPDHRAGGRKPFLHFDVVQATRGCPHECDFCSITTFHQHTYRRRPVNAVAEECAQLGRTILFADDNLTASPTYALDLFEAIRPLRRHWFGQCSVSVAFDPELLGAASRSGCRGMFVGLETLSTTNLSAAKKSFNRPAEYAEAIRRFHARGIIVFAGIVFGMDDDREDVFEPTLRFLEESGVDLVAANVLTPFPGTPLFDRLEQAGRIRSRDFALYDLNHVVYEPEHMDPDILRQGTSWVRAEFYSARRILRRLRAAAAYLDPGTLFGILLPINAGFYTALRRGPTIGHAARFRSRISQGGRAAGAR